MATQDLIGSDVRNLTARPPIGWRMYARAPIVILSVLALVLLGTIVFATRVGTVGIEWQQIVAIVLKRVTGLDLGISWNPADEAIIWQLRLPRVLGAALVGAGLAGAGVIFQGLLRNSMADPYLLGTSGGAALAATIAFFIPLQFGLINYALVPVAAFIGALIVCNNRLQTRGSARSHRSLHYCWLGLPPVR